MIIDHLKYLGLFVLVILLQVLIFDNIYLFGKANIFFYVLLILLLPVEINKYFLLVIGFFLGLSIDIFNNTIGMHAAASVFISFLRPYVLELLSPRDGFETGDKPRIYIYGFAWFLKYSFSLLLFHHVFYYTVEVFRFDYFFDTLLRVILSSIASLFFIVLSQLIVIKRYL
jgi:rod shape-determining protein MreD